MDNEDFNDMSKEDLLAYIKKLREQRAFTYEDRTKLEMIDKAPFTFWASDKDCRIKLWGGKCFDVYGKTEEDVIGKDYIPLFVSKYESRKARVDCRDIIELGTPFNNIANDETHDGVKIVLQTNCFRFYDVETQEPLIAEIGVKTNSITKQKSKTNQAIILEKKVEKLFKTIDELQNRLEATHNNVKYNKLFSDLSILKTEHDLFEVKCNKWDSYVEYISEFESKIRNIESQIKVSPNSIDIKDTKSNNGIPDDLSDKI